MGRANALLSLLLQVSQPVGTARQAVNEQLDTDVEFTMHKRQQSLPGARKATRDLLPPSTRYVPRAGATLQPASQERALHCAGSGSRLQQGSAVVPVGADCSAILEQTCGQLGASALLVERPSEGGRADLRPCFPRAISPAHLSQRRITVSTGPMAHSRGRGDTDTLASSLQRVYTLCPSPLGAMA